MSEYTPSVAEDARYLREHTSHITEGLKHTLEPALGTIALKFSTVAYQIFSERQALRDFYPGSLVPYRFANIPTDFFGDEEPHHFGCQEELNNHIEAYWQKDAQRVEKIGLEPRWHGRMPRIVSEELGRTLLTGESAVNLDGWKTYRLTEPDIYHGSKSLALNAFYTALVRPQAEADGYFNHFPAQNESALIMNTSLLVSGPSAASLFRVPIMLGDVELTRRFMNACLTTTMLIANNQWAYEGFEDLLKDDDARKLIHKHVQRANPEGGTPSIQYDATKLHHMSIEGMQSVASAYSLMAKEQPDGYPYDGARLIMDLTQQNMADKFARLIPFGFIGPTSLFGRYIPDLLYAEPDEKYEYRFHFTPQAKRTLQAYSDHITTVFARKWREYNLRSKTDAHLYPPVQTGKRCPFTGKTRNQLDPTIPTSGAITQYSNVVGAVFEALHEPFTNEYD